MKFLELHARLRATYGPSQVNRAETFGQKISSWLSEGYSVAAVFIGDAVCSVHNDEGAARNAARSILADGHNGEKSVRIKRIVL